MTNYHGESKMFVCTFSGCGRKFLMKNNFHKHIKMHMTRERSDTGPDERDISYFAVKDTNDESHNADDIAYFDLRGAEPDSNEGEAKIKNSLLVEWKRWEIEQRKHAKRSLKIVGATEIKTEDEEIVLENNNSRNLTHGVEVASLDNFYNIEENLEKNKLIEILENVTVNDEDVANVPDLADDDFHIISVGREDDNNPDTEENQEKQRLDKGLKSLDNNYDNSSNLPNTSNEESFSDALNRFVDNIMAQDEENQDHLFQHTECFHSPPSSGEAEKSLGRYYYNVLDELHQDGYSRVISSTTCGTSGNELFEDTATCQYTNTCKLAPHPSTCIPCENFPLAREYDGPAIYPSADQLTVTSSTNTPGQCPSTDTCEYENLPTCTSAAIPDYQDLSASVSSTTPECDYEDPAKCSSNGSTSNTKLSATTWSPNLHDDISPCYWTTSDVCRFVRSIPGCECYVDRFISEEIDGVSLLLLSYHQLTSMLGVRPDHAIHMAALLRTFNKKDKTGND